MATAVYNGWNRLLSDNTEAGRMRLQAVEANLFDAATRVAQHSVEMYSGMDLGAWVKEVLRTHPERLNKNMKERQAELAEGKIGVMDFTNCVDMINGFLRKEALERARMMSNKKHGDLKKRLALLKEQRRMLAARMGQSEGDGEEGTRPLREGVPQAGGAPEAEPLPEGPAFAGSAEEAEQMAETLDAEIEELFRTVGELAKLFQKSGNVLSRQDEAEENALDELRKQRNRYAHVADEGEEIRPPGSRTPEAGPLYEWASQILKYIDICEARYRIYALFDTGYEKAAAKERFGECKIYVQKQIRELYEQHSGISFEFAGTLYEKGDAEYNFPKLVESMAQNWDTGIRYLTIVTNEDIPEMNPFFRDCLSGTSKYVDCYLVNRNALREAVRQGDMETADYIYFRLLYRLRPGMEQIYWKDTEFGDRGFARTVLYKIIMVNKNLIRLPRRLNKWQIYVNNINLLRWCEERLLSDSYFAGLDDSVGYVYAKEMEDAVIALRPYCEMLQKKETGEKENWKGMGACARRVIRTAVRLYFYMSGDLVFAHTKENGGTFYWRSFAQAAEYLENEAWFQSRRELETLARELADSEYFALWRQALIKQGKEAVGSEQQGAGARALFEALGADVSKNKWMREDA